MPKRISITAHLTVSELEQLYRQARDETESPQYQIIWLLAQGKRTEEVEQITGYSRTWICPTVLHLLKKRYKFT